MTETVPTSGAAETTAATRLRRLIEAPGTLVVPGAFNGLVARIFEEAGFGAVYVGGHGAAASYGLPDVGLITQTEMVDHVERIVRAVSVPVIADVDEGYGDVINVVRTVQRFEQAGVAGIQLEDQQSPKRCGHMEGKRLIGLDTMRRKVDAAASSRRAETVIVARTDALAVNGLDDALARLEAYAQEGADVLFLEAPRSVDQLKAAVSALDKPLLANISEGGKTPIVELDELRELGVKIALYPSSAIFATAYAVRTVARVLHETGSTSSIAHEMVPLEEFNDLAGLPQWSEIESRFLGIGTAG
jgi:2-methylisocitrate lyase-like PEP mutase family enzyme